MTIVIPAFNEEAGIGEVLERTKVGLMSDAHEIIVVDDGSSDRTREVCERAGVRVIRHAANRGYGASLKTGIRAATTELVLTMDADGQHRVEDALTLLATMREQRPDLVVGARTALMHSPLWRMPGKWVLGWMAEYLTRHKIPDLNCGLRVIKRDVALRFLHLCPQGFSFSTTITMSLLARGYQVVWSSMEVQKRVGTSTVSIKTGLETLLLVLRLASLFNPLRVFIPLSVSFITVGIAWGIPYVLAHEGVTVGAMMSVITGVNLFGLGLLCEQVSQLRLERYD